MPRHGLLARNADCQRNSWAGKTWGGKRGEERRKVRKRRAGRERREYIEGGEGQEEVVMVKVGVVSPTAVVVMVYVWKVRVCVLQGHCRERPSSKSAF